MKAIILTSVLVALFSLSNIYAGNSTGKIYSNIENNEFGCVKEFVTVDSKTSIAKAKSVYVYDVDGILQTKVLYRWSNTAGWVGTQKYEYEYSGEKVVALIYTEWDKNISIWSAKAECLTYVYNINGELLTVVRTQVGNNSSLLAEK
jgi:hypothetical protein